MALYRDDSCMKYPRINGAEASSCLWRAKGIKSLSEDAAWKILELDFSRLNLKVLARAVSVCEEEFGEMVPRAMPGLIYSGWRYLAKRN